MKILKFKIILLLSFAITFVINSEAQDSYKKQENADSLAFYPGGEFYKVQKFEDSSKKKHPKNVILMIGDGMGISQIFAGIIANRGDLYIKNFTHIGLSTNQSLDKFVTGSAGAATALATGQKSYNKAIGVDRDKKPLKNIREIMQEAGKATGVVATASVTHATPACFVAHQPHRDMEAEIAEDYVDSGIDVFIGGGYDYFGKRKDGMNLIEDLENNGYTVVTEIAELNSIEEGRLAGLLAPDRPARVKLRRDFLEQATQTAINILDNDKDGFFLMIEGSQIDWGGHSNDTQYIIEEMLDFDKAIAKALSFAADNKETLIIVTADHETGGFSINGGDFETGEVKGGFNRTGHTGVLVPVFAFGPGAGEFTGFMDNTDIPKKILKVITE